MHMLHGGNDSLELIRSLLPAAVHLDSNLDAAENDLFASLEIDAQLHNIAVLDRVGARLGVWTAEADVIEKGARTALDVLDEPLASVAPQFAVSTADDLALEAHWARR